MLNKNINKRKLTITTYHLMEGRRVFGMTSQPVLENRNHHCAAVDVLNHPDGLLGVMTTGISSRLKGGQQ